MDFLKDMRAYINALTKIPTAKRIIHQYERGLITLHEAFTNLQDVEMGVIAFKNSIYENVVLDRFSEYCIEDSGIVSVMVEGLEYKAEWLADKLGINEELKDYIDIYCYLNAKKKVVESVAIAYKFSDDTEEIYTFTDIPNAQLIYEKLVDKDSDLKSVLSKSLKEVA